MDGYIGRGVGASSTSIIPFIHRRGGEKCTLRDGYDRVATRAKTKQISISRNRADPDCWSQINPRVNHDGCNPFSIFDWWEQINDRRVVSIFLFISTNSFEEWSRVDSGFQLLSSTEFVQLHPTPSLRLMRDETKFRHSFSLLADDIFLISFLLPPFSQKPRSNLDAWIFNSPWLNLRIPSP